MGHTLKFNPAAVKALAGNTRVRLLTKTRGGEVFFALRPSYRVSGKNVQLRVEPIEGEKHQTADLPKDVIAQVAGLPELKNNTHYHMEDIGYQWFILKASDTDIDDKKPGIYVTRLREKAVKKTEDAAAAPADATATDTQTTDTAAGADTQTETAAAAADAEAHQPAGDTVAETDVILTTTAESTGGDTGEGSGLAAGTETMNGDAAPEAAADEAPAEQAAASAKPKRVRPSRAKAKVDAKAE
jgi:hypothetical protein